MRRPSDDLHKITSLPGWEMLFDTIPHGSFLIGLDLDIVKWNRAAEEKYGWSAQEAIGQNWHNMLAVQYLHTDHIQAMDELYEQGYWKGYVTHIKKNGARFPVLSSRTVIRNQRGKPAGALVITEDLSILHQVPTQLIVAEEALRVSEAKYRVLFESFPLGISITDKAGNILETNHEAERLLGITRKEHVNRSIDGEEWRIVRVDGSPMPPEEYASVRALKENRLIENVEMGIVKGKDKITWINVNAAPIPTETYGLAITYGDITERRQAQEALRRSEEQYRSLFNGMTEGFAIHEIICDDAGKPCDYRFLEINPSFERLTGLKRDDVVGKLLSEILPDEDRLWVERYGEVALSGKSVHFENHSPELNRDYEVYAYRPAPGQFAVLFIDITERKKLDQLKDEFISMVSHEMRTPLTVIMGGLSTISQDGDKLTAEERDNLVKNSIIESEELAHILDNLLELSRSQANRLTISYQVVELPAVIHNVVHKFENKTAHHFNIQIYGEVPVIEADALRIERILFNLVQNAVKYSAPGKTIELFARRQDNSVLVGVRDEGPGISEKDHPRLFNLFQRIESKKEHAAPGIGLGLVVCRRLVEAHNGNIWVESQSGKGSTFCFTIPVKATARY